MRIFVFPLATLAALAGGFSDEPSASQMQRAFETSLATQVRNTLDIVAEVSGPEAVERSGSPEVTASRSALSASSIAVARGMLATVAGSP